MSKKKKHYTDKFPRACNKLTFGLAFGIIESALGIGKKKKKKAKKGYFIET